MIIFKVLQQKKLESFIYSCKQNIFNLITNFGRVTPQMPSYTLFIIRRKHEKRRLVKKITDKFSECLWICIWKLP